MKKILEKTKLTQNKKFPQFLLFNHGRNLCNRTKANETLISIFYANFFGKIIFLQKSFVTQFPSVISKPEGRCLWGYPPFSVKKKSQYLDILPC